jgi:hypothetical protein
MLFFRWAIALFCLSLSGCTGAPPTEDGPHILAMGDSLMAAHSISGRAIPDMAGKELGAHITDRSLLGARMNYALPVTGAMGMSIPKQYHGGSWDWVIVNGGGNDLWFGCGCGSCGRKMDKMISDDGRRGTIPGLMNRLRQSGAQVVYVGYLRSPGMGSPIESCRDEGDELDRRLTRLAALDSGIHFLPLADLVPHGDRSYHGIDMIHPSLKASREIGGMVADVIRHEGVR